jgi:hypothetical protein
MLRVSILTQKTAKLPLLAAKNGHNLKTACPIGLKLFLGILEK